MMHERHARYSEQRLPRYTSYPTAPHFHAQVGDAVYRNWLAALAPAEPVSLYLHVPFCRQLCWYCACHTVVTRHDDRVLAYAATLERELELLAAALPGRLGVSHLHWGGGSPTILPADALRRLFRRIDGLFHRLDDAELAMEIDPRALDAGRLSAIVEAGINRVSLGVQDFDPAVQSAINRDQPYGLVVRQVEALRRVGIDAISFDLMYGLPGQSAASVTATVEQALRLQPARVSLFGYAHVPWLRPHQRILERDGLPDAPARLRMLEVATARLEAAGYVAVGLDHFARPDDALAIALAERRLNRNFQGYTTDRADTLLGLGASAIGSFELGYVQNASDLSDYAQAVEAGRLPVMRGLALSDDDRVRREAIRRLMCNLEVDLAALASAHRLPPNAFDEELERAAGLRADGLIAIEGRRLAVTAAGRPLVRNVAALFDRYLSAEDRRHTPAI